MANSVLDMLIRGMPSGGPGLDPRFQTPGINPNAPDIRQRGVQQNPGIGSKINNGFGKLDSFLGSDGGSFLMNLLAQSGYSTVPGSPLGAIGRAGLATQQQRQAASASDLQRQFIESQIGLNKARSEVAGLPVTPKAETQLGKALSDFQNGLISREAYEAQVNEVIDTGVKERFGRSQSLRSEYNKETSGIRSSLQSLTSAQALLANGSNPIAELAAFISTIKSIDNSTVREGELATFNKASGLVANLENLVSRAKGEGFSPTIAADIADTVDRLRTPLESVLNGSKEFYAKEAQRSGVDPERIIGGAVPEAIDIGSVRDKPRDPGKPQAMPKSAERDGVTEAEWDVMSPEDRKLWSD